MESKRSEKARVRTVIIKSPPSLESVGCTMMVVVYVGAHREQKARRERIPKLKTFFVHEP